jgi:hypothetical protein
LGLSTQRFVLKWGGPVSQLPLQSWKSIKSPIIVPAVKVFNVGRLVVATLLMTNHSIGQTSWVFDPPS